MREEFLHFLWRFRRFDNHDLKTTTGEALTILQPGRYNRDSGPDFLDARLRIGETLWAGNVELHLQASGWQSHGHQRDPAYENVILHVVLDEDQVIFRKSGARIPCLELRGRIPAKVWSRYRFLVNNDTWVPCQSQLPEVPAVSIYAWLDRLSAERLEQSTGAIRERLAANQGDWENTFYQFLARNFGLKVNAEPFDRLARSLPIRLLWKHRHNLLQLEALLFGQSGLLAGDFRDAYPQKLQKEYAHLRRKYDLEPLPTHNWKFMRLRPANFPTLRIAQLATLIHQSDHLLSKVLAARTVSELENMFDVKLSNYWKHHYRFGHPSQRRPKKLGQTAVRLLVINTFAPFLFLYGQLNGFPQYQERALQLLEALPPEDNHVIRRWKSIGLTARSAQDSQALLQLKKYYCDRKACLDCAVGNVILR